MTQTIKIAVLAIGVILSISACTPTVATRGNLVSDSKMAQVHTFSSSKYDVSSLWGPPTAVAPFDHSTWYYIGETTEEMGIFKREITRRRVIEVKFDETDAVTSVTELDPTEAQKIAMVDRETPAAGNEPSVAKQFLGNIGRFNGGKMQK